MRMRGEAWSWFGSGPEGRYAYAGTIARAGVGHAWEQARVRVELAAPIVLSLPDDAVAAAPGGALGLGGNYFAANDGDTDAGALFVKQAYLELGRTPAFRVRLGRTEFADGAETVPSSPTLASVKRDRVAQRLLGPFGWSHAGRSFDGAVVTAARGGVNLTVLGGIVTAGAFRVEGGGELPVGVVYSAVTAAGPWSPSRSDLRIFGLYYRDDRALPKIDNRDAAVRLADSSEVVLATIGGHALQEVKTAGGPVDLLAWGAVQFGDWGRQPHRAYALALEAGWQPDLLPGVRPWLRVGVSRASGDGSPADDRHGSFVPILPTPRIYARLPFYTAMNLDDVFGTLLLRPGPNVTIRLDARALRLADSDDRWYAGGGAFERTSVGYAMRPGAGSDALATLLDASVEWRARRWATVTGYVGRAAGGGVVAATWPDDAGATFGYVEVELRR